MAAALSSSSSLSARFPAPSTRFPAAARTCALSSTAQSSWKVEPWSSGMGGLGYSRPSSSAMRPALNSSDFWLSSTSCTKGRGRGHAKGGELQSLVVHIGSHGSCRILGG